MAEGSFDPTQLSLDEQVAFLLEDTYFADEGGGGARSMRGQMAAELRVKLELSAKLREKGKPDWRLRAYIGADPTRTSLHIGHMVPVVRLRRFQQLGHQAIFLIGDYTAMIGDPTGQSSEREQLSHEGVLELARLYTDQAHRLLHAEDREMEYPGGTLTEPGAEVRFNGEWLEKLGFAEIAELLAQCPVMQVLARDDFRKRIESGEGLRAHELLYSSMQGYDAYALNCDVQVGGYDQHFNLLAGRVLQEYFARKHKGEDHPLHPGQRVKGPHVMLTYPLLMGTDGRKMSKSWGNTIDVLDSPEDMFGKVMRISDEMIAHYVDIAVDARPEVKEQWKARIAGEPMEVKKWVARSVTALYNGEETAAQAEEHFRRTVQERDVDLDSVPEVRVPDAWRGEHLGLIPDIGATRQVVAQPSVAVKDSEPVRPLMPRSIEDFRNYTRNLPHWRLSGSVYFLTWRLHPSHPELPATARSIVADALKHFHGERYHLVGYVVMNDHVHVLVKLLVGHDLSKSTHSWKSFAAHQIQREMGLTGAIWQDESWDRIVRDEDELYEKAQYMLNNPLKRWPGITEYEWVYLNLAAAGESHTATEGCATLASGHQLNEGQSNSDTLVDSTEELQQELQPRLVDLLVELQLAPSKSEARRLIQQGGVKLDGAQITDVFAPYIHVAPTLLQVGKRKVVRLV